MEQMENNANHETYNKRVANEAASQSQSTSATAAASAHAAASAPELSNVATQISMVLGSDVKVEDLLIVANLMLGQIDQSKWGKKRRGRKEGRDDKEEGLDFRKIILH